MRETGWFEVKQNTGYLCQYKGVTCYLANEHGCCSITACTRNFCNKTIIIPQKDGENDA